MANFYGKTSAMHIETSVREGQTYMSDTYYTPPLKLTRPFKVKNGGLYIIMMSSSPGIMEGDVQEYKFKVKEGSKLYLTSQTFEKIYKTIEAAPERNTFIEVEKNSYLKYFPLPTIPFRESCFNSKTHIKLEDKTSKFIMVEIISSGRSGIEERFDYEYFKLLTEVEKGDEVVYVDNTNFVPEELDMEGFGLMEGFSHLANVLIFNFAIMNEQVDNINKIISDYGFEGGITELYSGDHTLRILGNGAVNLKEACEKIIDIFEPEDLRFS